MITLFAFYFLHTGHFGFVSEQSFREAIAKHMCITTYIADSPYQSEDKTGKVEVCELL